jgi:hypothetical protein
LPGLRDVCSPFFAVKPRTRKPTFTRIDINLTFFGAWSMVADKKKQIREITELELKFVEEDIPWFEK